MKDVSTIIGPKLKEVVIIVPTKLKEVSTIIELTLKEIVTIVTQTVGPDLSTFSEYFRGYIKMTLLLITKKNIIQE